MTAAEVLAIQGQFMQSMMQFFQNQPIGAPTPPPPRDKQREFMQGHPPVFSHAADPLEADDWLRAVGKQLNIAQCDDQQKVLYASGQLQGATQTWWESYQSAHPNNAPAITWLEFVRDFKAHHIPDGLIELKQEEFRSLRMGSMSVNEYHDKFAQLARYAPNDVREDADKQCLFLKGIYYDLRLQLAGNTYANFQQLVNRAIVLDNMRLERDRKRKMKGQVSGSNTRPRYNNQQRYQGPVSQWNCGQFPQRSQNQQQNWNQRTPQQMGNQTPRQETPNNTPMKSSAPSTPNRCFRCGDVGHYANHCP
ncbi:uncharacterized protein [Miscanthus floridulus]|uniref:uncharacterized protein n=1 Tax=Miscanthus floridulus TaxID=154761 RepID=UPI00345AA95B